MKKLNKNQIVPTEEEIKTLIEVMGEISKGDNVIYDNEKLGCFNIIKLED